MDFSSVNANRGDVLQSPEGVDQRLSGFVGASRIRYISIGNDPISNSYQQEKPDVTLYGADSQSLSFSGSHRLHGRRIPSVVIFFRVRFQAYVARFTLGGKPRQNRTYSTYKNSTFPTMEDTLLFILTSMKTYPIQQAQAQLFGIQQSQANQWIHLLLPLVKQALADCGEQPARKNEDMNLDEDKAGLFVHDGTERPINRPQDPEEQRLYYSGKQKKHTIKNNIVIDEPCKIRFLSDTL